MPNLLTLDCSRKDCCIPHAREACLFNYFVFIARLQTARFRKEVLYRLTTVILKMSGQELSQAYCVSLISTLFAVYGSSESIFNCMILDALGKYFKLSLSTCHTPVMRGGALIFVLANSGISSLFLCFACAATTFLALKSSSALFSLSLTRLFLFRTNMPTKMMLQNSLYMSFCLDLASTSWRYYPAVAWLSISQQLRHCTMKY